MLKELTGKLASKSFAERQEATTELLGYGSLAASALRPLRDSSDAEVARRARLVLAQLETRVDPAVPPAAVRVLAGHRDPRAAEALFNYLPFAFDADTAEEARAAVAALAARSVDPPETIVRALEDADADRRASAVEVLARCRGSELRARLVKRLGDPDVGVRMRAAVALAEAGERAAVPVLVELMEEADAWAAEDVLLRLAGDDAPPLSPGLSPLQRRAAWRAWEEGPGGKADLGRLARLPRSHGLTWLLQIEPRKGDGQFVELDRGQRVRRQLSGLRYPLDVAPAGADRLLVAELQGNAVSEIDFDGKVHWRHEATRPIACKRLDDGRTFIACRDQVLELDAAGNLAFRVRHTADDVMGAARSAEGVVFVTLAGECHHVAPDGKPLRKPFAVAAPTRFVRIDLPPGGGVLVPETGKDRVAEYDAAGRLVWSAEFGAPCSAQRLANGRTLVASQSNRRVAELDRAGRIAWETPVSGAPTVAVRR